MRKRKILAVTGARSEYDLMYSVYKKLNEDDFFDFGIVITGPHLSERFGFTAKNILDDGFKVDGELYNMVDSDRKIGRVISIGNQIPLLAHTFDRIKPDMIIVAGDREEAISTTLTAAYLSIPVAHFFGGDVAKDGNIDNSTRYATSKFAHAHFVTLQQHKDCLLKLGEDEWRIHVIGNPALDRFLSTPALTVKQINDAFLGFSAQEDFCVLIQHSIITEVENQHTNIRASLDAILESGINCFLNYPNSDAGGQQIIDAYKEYETKFPQRFRTFKNLDRITYVNLLRHAKFLIGNSSSGLLEAPSLGLPAINVGSRQRGRVHGENVIFVENDKNQIREAIRRCLTDGSFRERLSGRSNPYGDGTASVKVINALKAIQLNNELVYKNITY